MTISARAALFQGSNRIVQYCSTDYINAIDTRSRPRPCSRVRTKYGVVRTEYIGTDYYIDVCLRSSTTSSRDRVAVIRHCRMTVGTSHSALASFLSKPKGNLSHSWVTHLTLNQPSLSPTEILAMGGWGDIQQIQREDGRPTELIAPYSFEVGDTTCLVTLEGGTSQHRERRSLTIKIAWNCAFRVHRCTLLSALFVHSSRQNG